MTRRALEKLCPEKVCVDPLSTGFFRPPARHGKKGKILVSASENRENKPNNCSKIGFGGMAHLTSRALKQLEDLRVFHHA